jgi:hypothetical protein
MSIATGNGVNSRCLRAGGADDHNPLTRSADVTYCSSTDRDGRRLPQVVDSDKLIVGRWLRSDGACGSSRLPGSFFRRRRSRRLYCSTRALPICRRPPLRNPAVIRKQRRRRARCERRTVSRARCIAERFTIATRHPATSVLCGGHAIPRWRHSLPSSRIMAF